MFKRLRYLWRQWRYRGRGLFHFWDGSRWRSVDPLRTYRRIYSHPDLNPDVHFAAADNGAEPYATEFFKICCDAFEVKTFADGGLTDGELHVLFVRFANWLDQQKKSTGSGSDSSPPTAGESSTSPAPLDEAESFLSPSGPPPESSESNQKSTPCEADLSATES